MTQAHGQAGAAAATAHGHAPTGFIRKYVFSLDHKVIGIQYYFLALTAVCVGMILSLAMRIHMVWPDASIPFFGAIKPEQYLTLMTMHGTIMVFFVLTTAPQSGFGNYFLPIQIGAPDMAFPTLNMLSFWTTFVSFAVMISAFFVAGGAPLSGWTNYPPLSAIPLAGPGEGLGEDLWIISIALFCVASMMGALNFITTTLDLRAKGMTLMRMPLTCWSWFITAILGLLAFGVLLAGGILLLMDRNLGTSFFVPGGLMVSGEPIAHSGGSPLLWQHLFWFFGHPEVYIAILPGMGVASQLLSTFSRKPIFGYKAMVYAMMSIGVLGFMVWGHHMFVAGQSMYASMVFSILSFVVAVPSAIKVFNWTATLHEGWIRFDAPMLYAFGFIGLLTIGGLTGLFLAALPIDVHVTDTYFVVAHFHYIMVGGAVMGYFAGLHYWWPKITGRCYPEYWARFAAILAFFGFNLTFFPQFILGYLGMPRRYQSYPPEFQIWHVLSSAGASILAVGYALPLFYFLWSILKGARAPANPWNATGLEWSVPSPPPQENFVATPTVIRPPYQYDQGKPCMQAEHG